MNPEIAELEIDEATASPEIEMDDKIASIVFAWKNFTLDPMQSRIAQSITPSEIKNQKVKEMILEFDTHFTKDESSFRFEETVSAEELENSPIAKLQAGITEFNTNTKNLRETTQSERSSIDFMSHYVHHEFTRVRWEIRHPKDQQIEI